MKTQTKKFIYSLMFLGLITVFGCSPLNKMAELTKQQNMSATPSPLEVHADTVRFEMSVNLPLKMIKEGFTEKGVEKEAAEKAAAIAKAAAEKAAEDKAAEAKAAAEAKSVERAAAKAAKAAAQEAPATDEPAAE